MRSTVTARRVLLVGGGAGRYGADRMLLALARGLHERGLGVQVAVPEPGPLLADLAAVGVPARVAPVGVFRRVFGLLAWLRFLLLDLPVSVAWTAWTARRVDVVHVNTAVVVGAALGGRLARRPVVWHLRESFAETPRLWRVFARVMSVVASEVVAISTELHDDAVRAGVRRVRLIHDGIELPLPAPARQWPAAGVVTVGRINSWKGQDLLVEALARLVAAGVPVTATFAGDYYPGQERYAARLRERVAELGLTDRVSMPGFVDDVAGLLQAATMYVQPSQRAEPFGLALAEAMAHGLACVATAGGGPADMIRDGETGLLVPFGDVDALAAAVQRLWTDPPERQRLGAAAADEVRRRFTVQAMTDAVAHMYEELVARVR